MFHNYHRLRSLHPEDQDIVRELEKTRHVVFFTFPKYCTRRVYAFCTFGVCEVMLEVQAQMGEYAQLRGAWARPGAATQKTVTASYRIIPHPHLLLCGTLSGLLDASNHVKSAILVDSCWICILHRFLSVALTHFLGSVYYGECLDSFKLTVPMVSDVMAAFWVSHLCWFTFSVAVFLLSSDWLRSHRRECCPQRRLLMIGVYCRSPIFRKWNMISNAQEDEEAHVARNSWKCWSQVFSKHMSQVHESSGRASG